MKQATFYVDFLYEANEYESHLTGRYRFDLTLTDEEYEDLYNVWYSHDEELNSWSTDWTGQDAWYERINDAATYVLFELMKKHEPDLYPPLDVLWELSSETTNSF